MPRVSLSFPLISPKPFHLSPNVSLSPNFISPKPFPRTSNQLSGGQLTSSPAANSPATTSSSLSQQLCNSTNNHFFSGGFRISKFICLFKGLYFVDLKAEEDKIHDQEEQAQLERNLRERDATTTRKATGEDFSIESTDTRRPFRALLDVGLIRTKPRNRVFSALKVPINPYGKAKKMAEDMILDFSRNSNMAVMILRYFNVIGFNLEGRLGEAPRPELREHGRIPGACFEEGMIQRAVEERMKVVRRENEETIEAMIDAGKLMVPPTMPRQDTSED